MLTIVLVVARDAVTASGFADALQLTAGWNWEAVETLGDADPTRDAVQVVRALARPWHVQLARGLGRAVVLNVGAQLDADPRQVDLVVHESADPLEVVTAVNTLINAHVPRLGVVDEAPPARDRRHGGRRPREVGWRDRAFA